MISDEAYRELEEAVGPENVSREPAVLDTYAWQPFANDNPERWVIRPVAVAMPGSTEEVQALVKALGRHGLKFKAFSTGGARTAHPRVMTSCRSISGGWTASSTSTRRTCTRSWSRTSAAPSSRLRQ